MSLSVYPKSCTWCGQVRDHICGDDDDDDDVVVVEIDFNFANHDRDGKYFGIGNTSRTLCFCTIRLMKGILFKIFAKDGSYGILCGIYKIHPQMRCTRFVFGGDSGWYSFSIADTSRTCSRSTYDGSSWHKQYRYTIQTSFPYCYDSSCTRMLVDKDLYRSVILISPYQISPRDFQLLANASAKPTHFEWWTLVGLVEDV